MSESRKWVKAIARDEHVAEITAAGLQEVRVVCATDAAGLLADDCRGGVATGCEPAGAVTSIHVTARTAR